MTKEVLSKEVANEILKDILSYYEQKSILQNGEILINLLISGRLIFCEDHTFDLDLFSCITDHSNVEINKVNLSMFNGQVMVDSSKNNRNDMEVALFYIASSAKLPLGSIFKMSSKDIKNCQAVIELFL